MKNNNKILFCFINCLLLTAVRGKKK